MIRHQVQIDKGRKSQVKNEYGLFYLKSYLTIMPRPLQNLKNMNKLPSFPLGKVIFLWERWQP